MDLTPLGSDTSTNSLFELLTVYTGVPARALATCSELSVATAACFGCASEAKGGRKAGRWSQLTAGNGEKFPARDPASRLVSSIRLESSVPSRWEWWLMNVGSEERGLKENAGFGNSIFVNWEEEHVEFGVGVKS